MYLIQRNTTFKLKEVCAASLKVYSGQKNELAKTILAV